MKKLSFLYYVLLIASVGFITSCGNNDDDTKPVPTVKFVPDVASATIDADTSFPLSVTYHAEEKIKAITVYVTLNGTKQNVEPAKTSGFNSDKEHTQVYDLDAAPSGSVVYEFEVEDKDGKKTSKSFTLTTKVAATALTEVNSAAKIFNKEGTGLGAFDLDNNKAIGSTADGAELQDLGWSSGSIWAAKWVTENGAYIQKVTGIDYATATKEQIVAAFGTSTNTTTGTLANNDLYVVKTTAGAYYLIKVVTVTNTDSDNNDNVVFAFKK